MTDVYVAVDPYRFDEMAEAAEAVGLHIKVRLPSIGAIIGSMSDDKRQALKAVDGVESIMTKMDKPGVRATKGMIGNVIDDDLLIREEKVDIILLHISSLRTDPSFRDWVMQIVNPDEKMCHLCSRPKSWHGSGYDEFGILKPSHMAHRFSTAAEVAEWESSRPE